MSVTQALSQVVEQQRESCAQTSDTAGLQFVESGAPVLHSACAQPVFCGQIKLWHTDLTSLTQMESHALVQQKLS